MSRTIRIPDVDDRTYRVLRARAATAGLSLSAYVLRELTRPTIEELLDRPRARGNRYGRIDIGGETHPTS